MTSLWISSALNFANIVVRRFRYIEMENDIANGTNTIQQFLDAEFGDNADIHICGICKLVFADIDLFVEHKKQPCGGFFIASVKSLHPRGYGRSSQLQNARSPIPEDQVPSRIQEKSIDPNDASSKLAAEIEERSQSLMEENVTPDTVTILPQPCVEIEVNLGSDEHNSKPNLNPPDHPLSDNSTLAECVTTVAMKPISKPRKAAAKDGKVRKYTCDHPGCGYACAYPKDLMRHLRIHSGEQPFECATCKKKFNRSDKLRLHMRSHTGEKPYHCDVCKYSTSDHSSLNKHLRIHTGEKPYRCQICPYASRNSSQLVVHLRTHTLDAPYSCKICQRTFKISTDLRRHEQLHTGEKPFKCDACDYKCAFKGNLKMHFRLMHSTENLQKCPQCDFSTPSRKAIRQHLKSHEPKDISCPYSGCIHVEKSLHPLSIHVLTHHKEEPFKCVYCLYLSKQSGSVCKHVKRYYPSSSVPLENITINGTFGKPEMGGQTGKALEDGKVNGDISSNNHVTARSNSEEETSTPKPGKRKPKKRLSKNLKRAIVCKPLCVPHFGCRLCPAAFVREDSLRSHLRQHQARKDSLVEDLKTVTNKTTEQDSINTADAGVTHSVPADVSPVLKMDGFQPVLEAISDTKEQVIEQALRQSGIFCLEQMQSNNSSIEINKSGDNLKDNPNSDGEIQAIGQQGTSNIESGQSQMLATITTLGSTLPVRTSVQEGDSNAVVPLQTLCSTAQGDAGPLVYEVQHCFLVPYDSSVADTTQYIVQAAPGGFVQFMNSTENADKSMTEKGISMVKCAESKTAPRITNKNRPIMPKPQADMQYLTFDIP